MIPTLIIWLLRKYLKPSPSGERTGKRVTRFFKGIYRKITLSILLSLLVFTISAQEPLTYDITYKGDNVGSMRMFQKKSGNSVFIKMVSSAQLRFIFSIKILSEEESVFKDGKLVYSMIKRNVNGKENTNKLTKASGDLYQTSSGGEKNINKDILIDYNLHLLYIYEPVNIKKVYSDNFQQFVPIQRIGAHQYKIPLPDGNYNYYSFENGICSKVEVHTTLYSIQIKLKK
ncbi:MAG: DUF6134 family protein [Chitinophagaceae bacterium]